MSKAVCQARGNGTASITVIKIERNSTTEFKIKGKRSILNNYGLKPSLTWRTYILWTWFFVSFYWQSPGMNSTFRKSSCEYPKSFRLSQSNQKLIRAHQMSLVTFRQFGFTKIRHLREKPLKRKSWTQLNTTLDPPNGLNSSVTYCKPRWVPASCCSRQTCACLILLGHTARYKRDRRVPV